MIIASNFSGGIFFPLYAWLYSLSPYEFFGTISGLLCVWLYGRESVWAWPIGIINTLLFFVMFIGAKLYSDAVLQVVFFILSIHGWASWVWGGPQQTELPMRRGIPFGLAIVLFLFASAVTGGAGMFFAQTTDAALPYWDASILAFSLVAQWLLNRKILENWIVWCVVDVMAVGVYAQRELYLTAALYAVFFVLAARGFVAWSRRLRNVSRPDSGGAAVQTREVSQANEVS